MSSRVEDIKKGVRKYINTRIEIFKDTVGMIESRIRIGEPVLAEFDIFVAGLSTEFGEKTKKDRIRAIRELMASTIPKYREFSTRRLVRGD